jgi:hypothetical protein
MKSSAQNSVSASYILLMFGLSVLSIISFVGGSKIRITGQMKGLMGHIPIVWDLWGIWVKIDYQVNVTVYYDSQACTARRRKKTGNMTISQLSSYFT